MKDRVRELRNKLGMTQQELAEASGLSFTFINYLENGKRKNPSQETITALAKSLNSTPEYLMGSSVQITNVTFKSIPVISWVQAGKWHEAIDNYPPGVAEEWIPYETKSKGTFALKVTGNSMEPEYRDGDLIIVNPQIEAKPGDDVIAKNGGGEVTFKRLKIKKPGEMILLSPLNPNYQDMVITGKDLKHSRIIGVVEGLMRKRKRK